jgi:hypothetical protein
MRRRGIQCYGVVRGSDFERGGRTMAVEWGAGCSGCNGSRGVGGVLANCGSRGCIETITAGKSNGT